MAATWQKRFKKEKKLADTLQGHIYLAADLQRNSIHVVVKETYKTLVDTGKSRDGHVVHEDFHNETRILTYLSRQPDADEGFCRIIYEWETEDCFYYAMQFCEAELFKFISNSFAANGDMYNFMKKETSKPQVPCDKNDAHKWLIQIRSVFRQCVQCCYFMHVKGICHLDLSLENTMIYKVDGLKVKIIDFGLAKHFDYKNNPKHANFLNDQRVGKRGYMAPEVYNKMIYDCRKADIWSLGVMLFMMLVGAPPYKRATQRDAAFNYIINGMLEDVLKHWRRLRLISKDALDCMEKIFKWEKDRINMEQLVVHPFVDLPHLLEGNQKPDAKNAYIRIRNVVCEYHNKYALPMQAQYNQQNDDNNKSNDGNIQQNDSATLIKFTTDAIAKTDKLILPSFVTACNDILKMGNIRLLDDFNHILNTHNKNINILYTNDENNNNNNNNENENENETKESNLSDLYESLLDMIKNKQFIHIDNSIIIRRNFRNRKKCESEKALLEVYGKYNKNVINDDVHRMAMQIMDKIYFYFAYTYNFGYILTNDEIKQLTNKEDNNKDILFNTKQLLKRKKQEILKTKCGKQIYSVMRDRKVKYITSTFNCFTQTNIEEEEEEEEEEKEEKEKEKEEEEEENNKTCIVIFGGIIGRMEQYLLQLKKAPKTMSHRDFVKFLKTLQIRSKKEERFSALKGISSDAWKGLINKFDALQMTEGAFNGMSKKQFGSTLKRTLGTGYIVKIHKIMSEELIRIQKDKFFTTKERIEDCNNIEILKLLLAVLREIDAIDIENDLNINLLAQLLGNNINGKEFLNFDEEYIINEFIMKSLYRKFSYINAHRFGKRFRYWPAYSDNKTSDLLNGFFTHHWYVRPKFNDIKEEILNNQICSITVNQWNRTVLFASKVIIRTVFIKKLKAIVEINKKDGGSTSNSSYNKYGVKNNDRIRLEHLVPLLIYINLDFVSKQLILTYNNNNNYIHNKYSQWIKYMKNHSQLSHLARLVRETVECYGEISTNKNQMTFYHLVDKSIPSSSLHTRFFSPTSVTTSLNTAFILNDFNDNEIIFELKCNQQSNLKYFNCSFLSDFPNEHEYIICGGLGTAKITNIYDLCLSQNYIYYIKAIEILFNIMNNQKPNDDKYDNNTMQKIGKCLNSLMQIRYKINKDKNVNVNDIINNEENTYIHNMFNQICNNIDYAQINLNYVLLSPLMKAVLLNNRNNSIRFDVLTSIFTNIQKYYIILKDIKININDIIFNENIIKFIQQKEIKSIKFSYVDQKIKSNDNFKNYKEKFMKHGYQLSCYTFTYDKYTTLSIDRVSENE